MAQDFTIARINMVENQVRTNDVTDLPIQDAMRVVARERFCPPGKTYLAYAEAAVEYAPGWFLMEPRDVSKLLQAVFPQPGQRALAIAAPYAAAVLARMGLQVTLLTLAGPPARMAAQGLADQGLGEETVTLRTGDIADAEVVSPGGSAPYDVIICEGAVVHAPQAWITAIDIGGRMGVVERRGPVGKAKLYLRSDDGTVSCRDIFDSSPPVMTGFQAAAGFTF